MDIWIFSGEEPNTMRLANKVSNDYDDWGVELRKVIDKLVKANIDRWTYYICLTQPNSSRTLAISMSQCSASNIQCTVSLIGGKSDMRCIMSLKDTLDFVLAFFSA